MIWSCTFSPCLSIFIPFIQFYFMFLFFHAIFTVCHYAYVFLYIDLLSQFNFDAFNTITSMDSLEAHWLPFLALASSLSMYQSCFILTFMSSSLDLLSIKKCIILEARQVFLSLPVDRLGKPVGTSRPGDTVSGEVCSGLPGIRTLGTGFLHLSASLRSFHYFPVLTGRSAHPIIPLTRVATRTA